MSQRTADTNLVESAVLALLAERPERIWTGCEIINALDPRLSDSEVITVLGRLAGTGQVSSEQVGLYQASKAEEARDEFAS